MKMRQVVFAPDQRIPNVFLPKVFRAAFHPGPSNPILVVRILFCRRVCRLTHQERTRRAVAPY